MAGQLLVVRGIPQPFAWSSSTRSLHLEVFAAGAVDLDAFFVVPVLDPVAIARSTCHEDVLEALLQTTRSLFPQN